jgi:hypothetical protein
MPMAATFRGSARERIKIVLGQSPSTENTDLLPPWRVRLNVLCSHQLVERLDIVV